MTKLQVYLITLALTTLILTATAITCFVAYLVITVTLFGNVTVVLLPAFAFFLWWCGSYLDKHY